jgi:hypothetical protein
MNNYGTTLMAGNNVLLAMDEVKGTFTESRITSGECHESPNQYRP